MKLIFFIVIALNISLLSQIDESDIIIQKKQLKEFLETSLENPLTSESIIGLLDSLEAAKNYSPAINSFYMSSCEPIAQKIIVLKKTEKEQKKISTFELKNYSTNYANQKIIVEGEVTDITKNSNNDFIIELSNSIECIFSVTMKGALKNISSGKRVIVKGTLQRSDNSNPTLSGCSFFTPRNLSGDLGRIELETRGMVNNLIQIIDKELLLYEQNIVNDLYKKAEEAFSFKKYNSALQLYNQLKELNPSFEYINEKIETTEKFVSLDSAQNLLSRDREKACDILYDLAYPDSFCNARSLYQKSFTEMYVASALLYQQSNNISGCISLFNDLRSRYQKSAVVFYDELYESFIPDFAQIALKYYKGDINNYVLIPEGEYFDETKKKINVTTFLVNPRSIDDNFIEAFNIVHAEKIFRTSLDITYGDKIELEKWIGVKFIDGFQYEYLNCDGWPSKKEKETFTDKSNNYSLPLSRNYLVINISETEKPELLMKYEASQKSIKEKINLNISDAKDKAFASNRVVDNYSFSINPAINYGSGDFIFNDPSVTNDSTYRIRMNGVSVELLFSFFTKTRGKRNNTDNSLDNYYYMNVPNIGTFYKFIVLPYGKDLDVSDKQNNFQMKDQFYVSHQFGIYYSFPFAVMPFEIGVGYATADFRSKVKYDNKSVAENYSYVTNSLFIKGAVSVLFIRISGEVHIPSKNAPLKAFLWGVGIQYPFLFGRK